VDSVEVTNLIRRQSLEMSRSWSNDRANEMKMKGQNPVLCDQLDILNAAWKAVAVAV